MHSTHIRASMAETAPLTQAHFHARKAAEETKGLHWKDAASEHDQAAVGFSKAARRTGDAEAHRILRLLEAQHRKLHEIIKAQDVPRLSEAHATTDQQAEPQPVSQDPVAAEPFKGDGVASSKARPTTSALAAAKLNSRTRDASPSLARDIASRRGIPPPGRAPPSAAAHARARQLSPESQRRAKSAPTPKIPPSIIDSQASLDQPRKLKKVDDEGFAKFYSNLTTGTMSKLSSALAYAGLPLTADDIQQSQVVAKPKPEKRTVSASNEPDVKKIFSKAALDAIEDDHRQRGTLGHGFGPAESFYVVQTGGGTYSYADIAKAQQQLSGIGEDDEDAFVDARELPGPPSPRHNRSSHSKRGSFGNPRTGEELELENTTLKHTLEQLASRLANFEAHAQDASMAALTQSMATLRPQVGGDTGLQERLNALEQQVEQQTEQRQKLEALAMKQEKKIRKYDEKWKDIRKSALEKQNAKREKADKDDSSVTAPDPG